MGGTGDPSVHEIHREKKKGQESTPRNGVDGLIVEICGLFQQPIGAQKRDRQGTRHQKQMKGREEFGKEVEAREGTRNERPHRGSMGGGGGTLLDTDTP